MADESTVDELQKVSEVAPKAAEAVESYSHRVSAALNGAVDSGKRFSKMLQDGAENLSVFLGGMDKENISSAIEKIGQNFSKLVDEISSDGSTRDFAIRSATAISTILLPAINDTSKAFGVLGASGVSASEQITASFSKFSSFFGKAGAAANTEMQKIFAPAESARNTELALIQLAAASGQLNQVFTDGVITQERLESVSASLTERIASIGHTTKQSSEQILAYVQGLGKIPGALDTWMKSSDATISGYDVVSASMKVASAYGLENTKVIDYLSNSYTKFGTSSDKAVEQLAFFAETSQDMGLPLEIMQSYLQKTSEGMNTMGDSTIGAVSLLDSFGSRLREVGTSALGTSDIVSGMMSSARDMDLGKAAYVNQASGGRGGLAGSFEIEALKQEGKFDEIVRRTMEAMQKTIGNPVTLGDVKDNPALAGQLLQQTEMLKQFGLAQNNSQAYRVLEAMKAGDFAAGGEAVEATSKTPQEALQAAIERGNDIASTGLGRLVELGNQAAEVRQLQAQQLLKFSRDDIGIMSDRGDVTDAVKDIAIQRVDLDAANTSDLGQATIDKVEGLLGGLQSTFSSMQDKMVTLISSIAPPTVNTSDVVMRPVDVPDSVIASGGAATAGRGSAAAAGGNTLDGRLTVDVNIRDGIRVIANETFDQRIEELTSRSAVQGLNGNGN